MQYTYEPDNKNFKLETYEWDNTWIDHANSPEFKRALYIGDSISCQIRSFATKKADGKIVFDLFGSSKSVDNPYFKEALKLFGNQQKQRDVILFNNGLHGWHLEPEDYKLYYEDMVKFLLNEFEDIPLILVLTTHADKQKERVLQRNAKVREIAAKYNLPVMDLYSESEKITSLHTDGVHFSEEGSEILAGKIVEFLEENLPELK